MAQYTKEEMVTIFNQKTKAISSMLMPATFTSNGFSGPLANFEKLNENMKDCKVSFVLSDTVSEIIRQYQENFNTCVALVFASDKVYGGGVRSGAKAQEEDVFRCTNLSSIEFEDEVRRMYPLGNRAFAVEGTVIMDANYNETEDMIPFTALFSSAPNCNVVSEDSPEYEKMILEKFEGIKTTAKRCSDNRDVLVLGAYGCGVFKNRPAFIADMMSKIVPELRYYYKEIVFAIPDKDMLDTFKKFN